MPGPKAEQPATVADELRQQLAEEAAKADAMWRSIFARAKPETPVLLESATKSQRDALRRVMATLSDGASTIGQKELVAAAARMHVIVSPEMIAASLPGGEPMNEEAFAQWWLRSTAAAPVLFRAAYRALAAKRATEAASAVGKISVDKRPAWRPSISMRARVAIGDVGAGFNPASSLRLAVLPSDMDLANRTVDAAIALLPAPEPGAELGLDREIVSGVATLWLPLLPDATDDDADEAVELFNATASEFHEAGSTDQPLFAFMRRTTNSDDERVIELLLFLKGATRRKLPAAGDNAEAGEDDQAPAEAESDSSSDGEDDMNPLQLLRRQLDRWVAGGAIPADEPPFEKLVTGIDFGRSAADFFAPTPKTDLLGLIKSARASAILGASDVICQYVEAICFSRIAKARGGRGSSTGKALTMLHLASVPRMLRSGDVQLAFGDPQEAITAATQQLLQFAVSRCKAAAKPNEVIDMCNAIRSRINHTVPAAMTPVRALSFAKPVVKLLGSARLTDLPGAVVFGDPSVRSHLMHCAVNPDAATGMRPDAVRCDGAVTTWRVNHEAAAPAFVGLELPAAAMTAVERCPMSHYVLVADGRSKAALKAGLKIMANIGLSDVVDNIKSLKIVLVTLEGAEIGVDDHTAITTINRMLLSDADDDLRIAVVRTPLYCRNGAVPADLGAPVPKQGAKKKNKDAASESDGDGSSAASSCSSGTGDSQMREILRTLLLALRRVTSAVSDVFFTDSVLDAHLRLVGVPMFDWVPKTAEQLDLLLWEALLASAARSMVDDEDIFGGACRPRGGENDSSSDSELSGTDSDSDWTSSYGMSTSDDEDVDEDDASDVADDDSDASGASPGERSESESETDSEDAELLKRLAKLEQGEAASEQDTPARGDAPSEASSAGASDSS